MSIDRGKGASPTYRAYRVRAGQRISTVAVVLNAATDDEAIAQALCLVGSIGVELWERARRVAVLSPRAQDGSD